jgi:hypothetical protein
MSNQRVFISYAWGGESEIVANEVEEILRKNGIDLVRDKTDLGFKGLIKEFMQEIGQGNFVVLIISDKYLKSKNCMFELMEVERKGEFFDRIFPIVLPDADIYDSLGILNYLKHWDQKIKALNASAKELDNLADTRKVQEDINLYTDIRGAIDDLAGKLSNMNTLTVEIMRQKSYQPLLSTLLTQSSKTPPPSQNPSSPSKKEGKVLYNIPTMMQVNAWTRCIIRLAWEEILIMEGLKIPEADRVVESIRLGSVMQVSLEEGRNGHNFEIDPISNQEQFIAEDDFTEWLFDVKPLNSGSFTLILRVTLVQIIEGKERKKDVVLERNVVTEAIVPQALARFETAETGLTPPTIAREGSSSLDLDKASSQAISGDEAFAESMRSREENWQPTTQPSVGSPPIPSPPPLASAPMEKSIIRRILPYAASVVILLAAGQLIFNSGSDFSAPEYADNGTTPPIGNGEEYNGNLGFPEQIAQEENPWYHEGLEEVRPEDELPRIVTSGSPGDGKLLLTFTQPNPTGSTDLIAFIITIRDFWVLQEFDFPMEARAFSIPDSIAGNVEYFEAFSPEKIMDSISKVSNLTKSVIQNPAIGSDSITVSRLLSRPEKLDESSQRTLQKISSKTSREN